MKGVWSTAANTAVAVVVGVAVVSAASPASAAVSRDAESGHAAESGCVSVRPVTEFYEAGRVASRPLTVPRLACGTISVSHVRDAANPSDRCQTFLVGFFPPDAEPTYTEPVTACAVPPNTRTVLASDVPDGAVYRILYDVDYIEPRPQVVRYKAWY